MIKKDLAYGRWMVTHLIISEYLDTAIAQAVYEKLEDDTFAGRIPGFKGVLSFGSTLQDCEDELRSTLEDWMLLGFKLGHFLPVIDSLDLNQEPILEPMDAL